MDHELPTDGLRSRRSDWRAFLRTVPANPADLTVALAASFTVDPLIPYLGSRALAAGVRNPTILNADYNQLMQVCLGHDRVFAGHSPDAIALLWRIEDIADTEDLASLEIAVDGLLQAIAGLRDSYAGMIIVGLPPRPRPPAAGLTGFSRITALERFWHAVCVRIFDLSHGARDIYTVDLDACEATLGVAAAQDDRKALLYRQPYVEAFYDDLAGRIYRLLNARTLSAKKCLVLDGDNTLWGGIIGEDGVGGVAIGQDFPGSAFRAFQLQVKALQRSGIFIAINSKNNPADVWELFDGRPEIILRQEDFSVVCVNWSTKSENHRTIARELNIGLDALVFIDDSHFEIAEVNAQTPEVTTLQVPEDVALLPRLLQDNAHLFDRLDLTEDDRNRVGMMRQETGRKELAGKLTEAEFLASLGLVVNIYPATEPDLARVVQLINKTNQFNVTTKRYSAEDITRMRGSGDHEVYCLSVSDRFGDYGLVGIGIVRSSGATAAFDTLLMSCRVLGRGIETAFISTIVADQGRRGAEEVVGSYRPTSKNIMVADLFARHGFSQWSAPEARETETWWRLAADAPPAIQPFLDVRASRPG